MRQKRIGTAGLLMVLLVVLAGCGGGSSNTSTPSPFAGSWSGSFTATQSAAPQNQNGTVQITVGTSGQVTGSITNTTLSANGTVSGSIANNGTTNLTYVYPSGTFTASGTSSINTQGQLVGSLQQFSNGTLFGTANFTLTKQ